MRQRTSRRIALKQCRLLALSRHSNRIRICPLLGAKLTSRKPFAKFAFNLVRTAAPRMCRRTHLIGWEAAPHRKLRVALPIQMGSN